MVGKCANECCLTPRDPNEGKVFRLDIELGNKAGGNEHKTAYIWLCASCAQKMHPKVQVIGNTISCYSRRTIHADGGNTIPQWNG